MGDTVVVDIDGVLGDFHRMYSRVAQQRFPDSPTYGSEIITDWKETPGLSKTQRRQVWSDVLRSPSLWAQVPLLPDVLNNLTLVRCYMEALDEEGRLVFVTSRPRNAHGVTARWLETNFFLSHPYLIMSDAKDAVAHLLKAEAAVDDSPGHAMAYAENGTHVFLRAWAYNAGVQHANITRVDSVLDFFQAVGPELRPR